MVFEGFPFRKDFPINGYIELRFDEEQYNIIYEPIEVMQEYRLFNFNSPKLFVKCYVKRTPRMTAANGFKEKSPKNDEDKSFKPEIPSSSGLHPRGNWETLVKPDVVKENIFTIPNAICLSRIALSPLLGYFVVSGNYIFGLAIFAYAAVSDLIDGWIARTFPSQQSVLGSALDPLADKVLISVLVLSLTYVDLIPLPLTALIVARDLLLVASGFVIRFITLEPPKTLRRYFDISAPSIRIKPTWISKFNTGVQLCMVAFSLTAPVIECTNHPILYAVWYLTAGTTIASGLSYIFAKDTYEIMRKRARRGPPSRG